MQFFKRKFGEFGNNPYLCIVFITTLPFVKRFPITTFKFPIRIYTHFSICIRKKN